ncbi:biotin--[biotin carboxyl-carrier protein] ligase [Balamuthia mandrillaris]
MMKRGGASTTEAQAAAATTSIGRCLIYLQETESTMDLAQQEMMNGGQSGTLILAEAQTKGRGRRGRAWASGHGENLASTLILHLDDFAGLFKVNFATAIAVVLACLDEDKDIQAKIKWPNDVWINGKKLCGILVDTSIQGKDTWAAVGVGVNVNQRISSLAEVEDKELQTTATSLRDVLGRNVQREVFLARYCNHMERLMSLSLPQIIEEYQRHDMLCGNTVLVMPKGKEDPLRVEAVALGFTETGSLRVRIVESGEEKELYAEEVSVRPTQPQQHNAL